MSKAAIRGEQGQEKCADTYTQHIGRSNSGALIRALLILCSEASQEVEAPRKRQRDLRGAPNKNPNVSKFARGSTTWWDVQITIRDDRAGQVHQAGVPVRYNTLNYLSLCLTQAVEILAASTTYSRESKHSTPDEYSSYF